MICWMFICENLVFPISKLVAGFGDRKLIFDFGY